MNAIWGSPLYLIVAGTALVLLALAYSIDFAVRRRKLEKIGHAPQLARMAGSVSAPKRGIKAGLVVVGIVLVALSLARPQREGEKRWRQRGIDVVLVLDFSKSMLAGDVYRSRTERAKKVADALVKEFTGNRVAVVAFAGASIHYPLTTDYEAARLLYNGITPDDMAPGSDVGEAILNARCILMPELNKDADCLRIRGRGAPRRQLEKDRARAIVLISDGEDTEGHAQAEVAQASRLGIQTFVVGVGTRRGDKIPEGVNADGKVVYKKGPDRRTEYITRLDDAALKELAKLGGGEDHYFVVDNQRNGTDGLVKALGKLKEGDLDARVVSIPSEVYQWPLFAAFMVLLIEACLSDRRRQREAQRVRA